MAAITITHHREPTAHSCQIHHLQSIHSSSQVQPSQPPLLTGHPRRVPVHRLTSSAAPFRALAPLLDPPRTRADAPHQSFHAAPFRAQQRRRPTSLSPPSSAPSSAAGVTLPLSASSSLSCPGREEENTGQMRKEETDEVGLRKR
ncbi:hypothetical protein M0R45_001638 [Rubus argutus]|uniref:Uncharacterized protein n=1 Tax=Rubus argutus TaxID=59490 RepID=A0AAW1VLP5_RUBAR